MASNASTCKVVHDQSSPLFSDNRSGPRPRPHRPRSGTPLANYPRRARSTVPHDRPSAGAGGSPGRQRYPHVRPFVTAGYCGIEQSFKFLIALRKGLPSVRKLLDEEKSARVRSQYDTHDLLFLFRDLDPLEQSQMSNDFRLFTSLYEHIPVRSLSEFLEIICSDRGNGYVLWRYSLTEFESALPSNSVEALLAVWKAGIQICCHPQRSSKARKTKGPNHRFLSLHTPNHPCSVPQPAAANIIIRAHCPLDSVPSSIAITSCLPLEAALRRCAAHHT